MAGFNKEEFSTTRAEIDAALGRQAGGQGGDSAEAKDVLVAGDVREVFSDVDTINKAGCRVCSDMGQAIETAEKGEFSVIGIVMSGAAELDSVLRGFRQANRDAKIVLLARMYEEPTAMKLIGAARNGEGAADDYLICPVEFSNLVFDGAVVEQSPAGAAVVDANTKAKIRHLEKLATTDELTGLKNRRYIWEFCRQIIELAGKKNGRVMLLVFDIDDFKHYNDVYGHSAGDEILRQAAVLMQRCCRRHDVVGRIGGDEFAVVFWDEPQRESGGAESERRSKSAEHPKEVIFIAQRFISELKKTEFPSLGPEGKGVLAISGGLASFPRDGSTTEELFRQADKALLEAKRSGKNMIYLVGSPRSDIANIQ